MVTSNKGGVGSLAPFLPLGFLAPPTPTSETWWPCTCRGGLWRMCFPARFRSPIWGLWLGPGVWATALAAPGLQGWGLRYLDRLPSPCYLRPAPGHREGSGCLSIAMIWLLVYLSWGRRSLGASWWMIAVWVLGLQKRINFQLCTYGE